MDTHDYYELKILEHLERSPYITHRMAAQKLGVSVKLTHSVIRGMIRRGWIHATRRDGRSLHYFLTPDGIAEKVRLTWQFLDFTRQFFQEARRLSGDVCRRLAEEGVRTVAFLGTGELAEIAYLGASEHGLRLEAVYDDAAAGERFMGLDILPAKAIPRKGAGEAERILVTHYDPAEPMRGRVLPRGVRADERFVWVFDAEAVARGIERTVPTPEADAAPAAAGEEAPE